MLAAQSIDWTNVIIVGVPSILSAIFAGTAMLYAARNGRRIHTGNGSTIGKMVRETRERTEDLQTPSGDPIGAVAERAEHLSAADVALTTAVHARVTNGEPLPPGAASA